MIALLLSARVAAAGSRAWEVQAGAGLSGADAPWFSAGRCWSLGVATPVRPWLFVGTGAEWHEFPAGRGSTDLMETYVYERSRIVAGLASVRLQTPISSGLAPYALVEAGAGGVRLGDLRWTLNDPRTEPGRAGFLWVAAAAVGLRLVLPPGWPEVDASVRGGSWSSPTPLFRFTHRTTFGELRLTGAW